jgi:hypothetical protein
MKELDFRCVKFISLLDVYRGATTYNTMYSSDAHLCVFLYVIIETSACPL